VILVHRLRGEPLYLNPDLIEAIEATPDTVLTLIDGRRTVVADTADEVVERILRFRATVLVTADNLREEQLARGEKPGLRVVDGGDD
jgi:flagellar protein FlbD